MEPAIKENNVVGVNPWLPWPLCRSQFWTQPVRAERMAALRIGIALVVALDVFTTYLPMVHDYYGPDSLSRFGDRDVFTRLAEPPSYNWSLLRGVGHPLNFSLALCFSTIATVWVFCRLLGGAKGAVEADDPSALAWGVVLWGAASAVVVLGIWARLQALPEAEGPLSLASSSLAWIVATLFLFLTVVSRARQRQRAPGVALLSVMTFVWIAFTLLLLAGFWRFQQETIDPSDPLSLCGALENWDEDPAALKSAMVLYLVAALALTLGCCTRLSAIATWLLATSFDNLNPYMDSNGDVIRSILLFYLMFCPCGAAWSVDAWIARWRGRVAGRVFVYPWVLRLLLLQMMVLYFFNGLYKLSGDNWREGDSMYYVMSNLTLSRVSFAEFHLPLPVLRVMTWLVVTWETGFPLLVILPRVRTIALCFGVAFHLGIWVTMELGSFAPCALCMYLPFVPWERWADRWRATRNGEAPLGAAASNV